MVHLKHKFVCKITEESTKYGIIFSQKEKYESVLKFEHNLTKLCSFITYGSIVWLLDLMMISCGTELLEVK